MTQTKDPAPIGRTSHSPWLRFLRLRTYGRTHLAVAWRVRTGPEAECCPGNARNRTTG